MVHLVCFDMFKLKGRIYNINRKINYFIFRIIFHQLCIY